MKIRMSILYSDDEKIWINPTHEQIELAHNATDWFIKNKKAYTDSKKIKVMSHSMEPLKKNYVILYPDDKIGYMKYTIPRYMRMKAEIDIVLKETTITKGSTYYIDTTEGNKIIVGHNGSINPPFFRNGKPMI